MCGGAGAESGTSGGLQDEFQTPAGGGWWREGGGGAARSDTRTVNFSYLLPLCRGRVGVGQRHAALLLGLDVLALC